MGESCMYICYFICNIFLFNLNTQTINMQSREVRTYFKRFKLCSPPWLLIINNKHNIVIS